MRGQEQEEVTGKLHLCALLQDVVQEGNMVPPQIPERLDISPAPKGFRSEVRSE